MLRFSIRKVALVGAVLAAVASNARAQSDPCSPCPAPCAPAAPAMRTVYVTECVPQQYQSTRTVYRTTYRTETYTAYRCQMVPQVREQVVTTYTRVPQVQAQVRRVCVNVPSVEERTVMKPNWTYQTVTTMTCKTVDRGHYECREVHSKRAACRNKLGRLCGKYDDCCNPCPPATKTVKCWVPCPVTVQVPVTSCKRVCVMQPCVVRVNVYKQVWQEQTVNVTTYRCVPQQQTVRCTVMVAQTVPYQATRCVPVCVPQQEVVTLTRMVSRVVARQVPAENCGNTATASCGDTCGDTCAVRTCCGGKAKKHHGRLMGGRRKHGASCCN